MPVVCIFCRFVVEQVILLSPVTFATPDQAYSRRKMWKSHEASEEKGSRQSQISPSAFMIGVLEARTPSIPVFGDKGLLLQGDSDVTHMYRLHSFDDLYLWH
jgi:hypothetical protein